MTDETDLRELHERRAASKVITAARIRHQLEKYADVTPENVALFSALDTLYLGDDEPFDAHMDAGQLIGEAIRELLALRPLRAAVLRYGAAELRCRQSGMPPSAEDVTAIQEEYEAHTALVALALALAAEEGQG